MSKEKIVCDVICIGMYAVKRCHFNNFFTYILVCISIREGSKCNCKKTPLLDELGHHISTACGLGGHRIMTHDSVCIS
jgi:hypothetical protein